MLKNYCMPLFFFASIFATISGYAWELEQNIIIEGVLRRAERTIIKNLNGEKETKIEKSIVLVTDQPLVLSRSVTIGQQQIASTKTSYSHIEVCLPEEFIPLIGKRARCHGNFRRSFDFLRDEILLDVATALDREQSTHHLKTVFYEPEEVEVVGVLQAMVYPGPPEYTSVEMGDWPEEVMIMTLKDSINVETKDNDDFNDPEQGVRELQVVFSDSMPSVNQMKENIVLRGALFHAHTAHHHRRVLMMVKSWSAVPPSVKNLEFLN